MGLEQGGTQANERTDHKFSAYQADRFLPKAAHPAIYEPTSPPSGNLSTVDGVVISGDTPFLEKILRELQQVGLVNCVQEVCTLANEAEIKASLKALGRVFDDPLARQTLLHQVSRPKPKHY